MARNRQNDRVYGKRKRDIAPNRLYHETSRFTKKVMVSAGVSWKGKTRIHFIDTERTKVNSESYKNLPEIGLLPECRRLYPNGDWVFQQDGAPAHTSKKLNFVLLYLVVFEILIPKVRNDFIESPDIVK